jgi:hypothetical protein
VPDEHAIQAHDYSVEAAPRRAVAPSVNIAATRASPGFEPDDHGSSTDLSDPKRDESRFASLLFAGYSRWSPPANGRRSLSNGRSFRGECANTLASLITKFSKAGITDLLHPAP